MPDVRTPRRSTWLAVLLLLAATAGPARAQDADALTAKGVEAYKAGHFEEALEHFQAAHARSHRAPTLYNMGRCQQKLGRFQDARETFETLIARDDLLRGEYEPYRAKARAALEEVRAALDALKPPEVPQINIPRGPVSAPEDFVTVSLPAFAIDAYEVTLLNYAFCVRAGACDPLPPEAERDEPSLPVRRVTWTQALAYCRYVDKRLPTEFEWQRAAAGPDATRYPWGAAADCARATLSCVGADGPTKPGAAKGDRSAEGAFDLAGNLSEWVADWYSDVRGEALAGPSRGVKRVVRGGSFRTPLRQAHTGFRFGLVPNRPRDDVGFRCARSIP